MKKLIGIFGIALLIGYHANAQHEYHHMQDTTKPMQMSDTMKMDHLKMEGMKMNQPMNHHMSMSHSYSLNLPMNRNGSGTGWLPPDRGR